MVSAIHKYLRSAAAVLLIFACLCGCTPQSPATEDTNTTPSGQQTEPSSPSTPSNPTQPTEPEPVPLPELEAVSYLSCVEFDVFPQLLSLGNGLVVACRNTYSPPQGLINETMIIDIYADQVLARSARAHSMNLVTQRFTDGAIVMAEPDSGKFYVFDRDLAMKRSFSAPNLDGYFSHDRSDYYFIQDEILCRMQVATGKISQVTTERELRFESLVGFHPNQNRIVARIYRSAHGTDYGLAVIDVPSGKLQLLRSDLTHAWLTEDRFYAVEMNPDYINLDVYYGDLGSGTVRRIPTNQLYAPSVSYEVLPGSDYLIRRLAPDEGDRSTLLYDMGNGGTVADLAQAEFLDAAYSPIFLPQEKLIFGYYSQKEEETPENKFPKETFHMVVINPEKLTFADGLTPEEAKWQTRVDENAAENLRVQIALPDQLTSAETKAAALESKYGIEILLGTQIVSTCDHSSYNVAVNADPAQAETALQILEQALAKYPAGFFRQLRNGAGEGGISICLAGSISGHLNPVGFTQKCRDRYEVVLNITATDLESTIHHELWHAIEMHLSTDSFSPQDWNACNPAGFTYYGGYDKGYLKLTKWTYDGGSGAASHFIDGYAQISPTEDRARIFERIMTGNTEAFSDSTALAAKLAIMARVIRSGFDTTGWNNVAWEQT